MAFFDDRKFLLSHIRHSFITCDDTGICEMAMLNEIMPHHLPSETDAEFLDGLYIDSKSELEAAQSFDIVSDMDMLGAHRRRSNTAQRLDRLKKERRNQAKIKVIHWKDNCYSSDLTDQDLDQAFPIKQLPQSRGSKDETSEGDATTGMRQSRFRSALSLQITKFPSQPNNPFSEYSQFDGRVCESTGNVKRISIFLTMVDDEREKWMDISVVSGARVNDLIGLICWHYANEGRSPCLRHESVSRYSLRISEESGDVDPDFPGLNGKELVSKFGFPFLALVEKEEEDASSTGLVVTVRIDEPQQTRSCKLEAANPQRTTLKWIYDQALRELLSSPRTGRAGGGRDHQPQLDYQLEVAKQPGSPVNYNTLLSDTDARDFKLVRCDANDFFELDPQATTQADPVAAAAAPLTRSQQLIEDENERLWDQFDMFSIEAPIYQEFLLKTLPKFAPAADICLGVSGTKIDMNMTVTKRHSHRPWSRQPKAISIPIEMVADCISIKANHTTGKTVFKIVYKDEKDKFSHHKFEGDSRQVRQIVRKIEFCMRMRSSSVRDEYIAYKKQSSIARHFSHHTLAPGNSSSRH